MSEISGGEEGPKLSPTEIIESAERQLDSIFEGVESGTTGHRAFVHLIAYETQKHEEVEAQDRARRSQYEHTAAMATADPAEGVYDLINKNEQGYWGSSKEATDRLLGIIQAQREADEEYRRTSMATSDLIADLERAHQTKGTEKPYAAVALTLRDYNEHKIIKQPQAPPQP